ncbi:MAG: hypothetical protein ACK5YA_00165 [bacterium]
MQNELELQTKLDNMNLEIQKRLRQTSDSREKFNYLKMNGVKSIKSTPKSIFSINQSSENTSDMTLHSTQESAKDFHIEFDGISTQNKDLVNQNLHIEDKFVKCILIGDKQVGKTLLRNKLLEDKSEPSLTKNLEIKKKLIFANNKAVKLELWDTNTQLLNTPITKSKLIFN